MMNKLLLEQNLSQPAQSVLQQIQIHECVDSTNLEALRLLESGHRGNSLIVASTQTAGRGRRGRIWHSPAHGGIYLSLLYFFDDLGCQDRLRPAVAPVQGLSLVAALSVLQVLSDLCPASLGLKWPNDVLVDGRKLAGILLETRAVPDCQPVVIGIGVNLSLAASERTHIKRPVCALDEWVTVLPEREALIGRLVSRLLNNSQRFAKKGFAAFQPGWNNHDCCLGTEVVVVNGNQRLTGKSLGVDAGGALLLQTPAGRQRIGGGEVFPSLRLPEEVELL